jgi:hypothetical protein
MNNPAVNPVAGNGESSLSLGPDLPMAVYHAVDRWHPDRIGALALYCSDGRWGEAFDEFCHRHLHIPRYDRWAVPGGPAWLVSNGNDSTLQQAAHSQLDFLVSAHDLEQIVLITHYGCAYYGNRIGRPPDDCLPVQLKEVGAASAVLRKWFPKLDVTAYLAMRRDSCLSFHELKV